MPDADRLPEGSAGEGSDRRGGGGALVAICVAYFMVILDTTVVNVALPSLGRSLGTGTSGLEWVVDAYSLVFAALLLSAGALADRQGAKAVFQVGVGVFAVASLACGLAPSTAALVAARALQGLGAAAAVPASLSLLQASYTDRAARRRALGIWGGVAGIAAGSGPVVGGALVSGLGWRSVFMLNLPIGAAGVLLGARHLPSTPRVPRGVDPVGQATGVVTLGILTATLIAAGRAGWSSPLVVGGLGVSAVSAAIFVAGERRASSPMLPPSLFASADFASGVAVGLLINLGFYGELFVLSLYFQQVHHLGVLAAGAALMPQMAMAVVGSTASGRVMARGGSKGPMLVGSGVGAAGLAALGAVAGSHSPYLWSVGPLVAAGLGMSLTMPAATATVMEAASPEQGGLASGTINAARQVGGVVGVAVLGSLVADRATFVAGLRAGMAVAASAFALGALLTAAGIGRPVRRLR